MDDDALFQKNFQTTLCTILQKCKDLDYSFDVLNLGITAWGADPATHMDGAMVLSSSDGFDKNISLIDSIEGYYGSYAVYYNNHMKNLHKFIDEFYHGKSAKVLPYDHYFSYGNYANMTVRAVYPNIAIMDESNQSEIQTQGILSDQNQYKWKRADTFHYNLAEYDNDYSANVKNDTSFVSYMGHVLRQRLMKYKADNEDDSRSMRNSTGFFVRNVVIGIVV